LMDSDNSGHGMDHIIRVYELALKFADIEKANKEIVATASLLHDVDDYKIVGKENSENLTNAKNIMSQVHVNANIQAAVLDILQNMGYSKSLKGIRPESLEGKIVSDADMCDAIGAIGIIRNIVYGFSKGSGKVFDRNMFPNSNLTYEEYVSYSWTSRGATNIINHFFEKLLKHSSLMMTEAGRAEAIKRQKIMIDFLRQFFIEENAPEWVQYLDDYLEEL